MIPQITSETRAEETVFNDSTDYLTPRQTIPIPSEYITAIASAATEPSSPRSFSQACYVNQQSTSVATSSNNINVPPPCQPQSINEHEYHEID